MGFDNVTAPKHYYSPNAIRVPQDESDGGINKPTTHMHIQALDVIKAWDLGFNLGNVIKYVLRAGKKDESKWLEDLKKARFYIDDEIKTLEKTIKHESPL
jgi:hypothetical protein